MPKGKLYVEEWWLVMMLQSSRTQLSYWEHNTGGLWFTDEATLKCSSSGEQEHTMKCQSGQIDFVYKNSTDEEDRKHFRKVFTWKSLIVLVQLCEHWTFSPQWWRRFCRSLVCRESATGQQPPHTPVFLFRLTVCVQFQLHVTLCLTLSSQSNTLVSFWSRQLHSHKGSQCSLRAERLGCVQPAQGPCS